MALKNWKKLKVKKGENELIVYKKVVGKYEGDILQIYESSIKNKKWVVDVDYGAILTSFFKTKTQAIKFARAYMRKH